MKLINQYLNYLILILVIGYISFYFYSKETRTVKKTELSSVVVKPNVDQVVNKYMQETSAKNKELLATAQTALKSELVKAKNLKRPIYESEIKVPAEQQIWKEQSLKDNFSQVAPDEEITQKLQNQEIRKAQEEAYKKEYSRQYIENARKNGYNIILDDNLNVIKATPIRRPSDEDSIESFPAE